MKKSLIYILLIIGTLVSSDRVFAEKTSFKERTDQWLRHSEKNLRGDGNGEEDGGWISPGVTPEKDPIMPNDVPVRDFLLLPIGFSLIYGAYIFGKKKKKGM